MEARSTAQAQTGMEARSTAQAQTGMEACSTAQAQTGMEARSTQQTVNICTQSLKFLGYDTYSPVWKLRRNTPPTSSGYQVTWCHSPDDQTIDSHHYENVKCFMSASALQESTLLTAVLPSVSIQHGGMTLPCCYLLLVVATTLKYYQSPMITSARYTSQPKEQIYGTHRFVLNPHLLSPRQHLYSRALRSKHYEFRKSEATILTNV
jgi:hypothetical protein